MKTVMMPVYRTALVLFILASAFFGLRMFVKAKPVPLPAPFTDLPIYGEVPDFTFIREDGKAFSRSELQGKIWIANFIFTHCAGVCPLMSAKMSDLQQKLAAHKNIRFVSFSVDPERDTPEALSAYGQKFKADRSRWIFLTGDKKDIHGLSLQNFRLGVRDLNPEERESADQTVMHSSKFVLIDAHDHIRGYYDTDEIDAVARIAADAERLVK